MSSRRYPIVRGKTIRLTKTDLCGRPAYGDRAQLVTSGFVSVAVTANYNDEAEITLTNANGRRCVQVDAESELLNLTVAVALCEVDPEAYTTFTGQPPIYDARTGLCIGFDTDSDVRPSDVRVALETWTGAQGSVACDPSDDGVPYGYLLHPYLKGGKVSDFTIENGAVTFTVSDMITQKGSLWAEGPYLVQTDETGVAAPLQSPVRSSTHQRLFVTTVAPPEDSDGLVPLDDPDAGVAATAVAGTPGHYTPTGAVRPFDLAELEASSVTASPATAWTTGQYVILGDGSKAHWTGTAYATGPAA